MKIITLKDESSFRRGLTLGKMLRDVCIYNLSFLENSLSELGLNFEYGLELAMENERVIEAYFPELLEEIRGLAEGAQIPYESILLKTAFPLTSNASSNCTVVSAFGDSSKDGTPVVERKYDFLLGFRKCNQLRVVEASRGSHPFVGGTVTILGVEGGLNNVGLFIGDAGWEPKGLPAPRGLSSRQIMVLVLERCESVDSALDFIREAPKFGGNAGTIYLVADRKEATILEMGLTGICLRTSDEGLLIASNVFLTSITEEISDPGHESVDRYNITMGFLHENRGKADLGYMRDLLSSHDIPICSHGEVHTLRSVIARTKEGRILVADGYPCASHFRRVIILNELQFLRSDFYSHRAQLLYPFYLDAHNIYLKDICFFRRYLKRDWMGILDDVRILDFSHVYYGPYTTMILADMGAEVIKVEPPWGEVARLYPPLFGGMSSVFLFFNRNKKGITLNLKSPKAVEIALKLASKSDVIVENFKRGTMEKLGLGYEDIRRIKPDIIYASLSGFGLDGPYASRPSFAPMASSISGWYRLTGDIIDPNGPPIRPAEWHGDLDPALWAAIAITGAVRHRDRTGEGQLIDVAQLDCMITQTGVSITSYAMSGELPWQAERKYMGLSAFGMFKAQDGWVYIAADPQMHERLFRAMGVERIESDDQLKNWVSERKVNEVVDALVAESVPVAPILQIDQTLKDPHVMARGIIETMQHPTAGTVRSPGFPVKFSKTPGTMRTPAPLLGQHNEEVLTTLLGYSKEQVEQLRLEGVIT